METQTTTPVEMTPETLAEFEAFKAAKAETERKQKQQADREAYKTLVDEAINAAFPILSGISSQLSEIKTNTHATFQQVLELKAKLYEVKPDQRSNMFTSSDGKRRIILGEYETDTYDDTVNEGEAKVKQYIGSLAKDADSKMLVNGLMKLLTKDKAGNLKASRVIQLRKMAEESGSELFMDGVRIIEAAHRPTVSKQFIRAEYKDENNAWVSVPLGLTEA